MTKNTLDSQSLCYVYVYLGYIEDRAGNRNEAVAWYKKALEIKDADRVRECAALGMEKPLIWIRHWTRAQRKFRSNPPRPWWCARFPWRAGRGLILP